MSFYKMHYYEYVYFWLKMYHMYIFSENHISFLFIVWCLCGGSSELHVTFIVSVLEY